MPERSIASPTTGMRISTSLRVGSSRALGDWANETTATSLISDVLPVRLVVGVGLAGRAEVLMLSRLGVRSSGGAHTASTRMPMRTSSAWHSWMRCISPMSAPSSRIVADTYGISIFWS